MHSVPNKSITGNIIHCIILKYFQREVIPPIGKWCSDHPVSEWVNLKGFMRLHPVQVTIVRHISMPFTNKTHWSKAVPHLCVTPKYTSSGHVFSVLYCALRVRFHIELAGMRLYANDMVMRFLSRIRRLEKVAIDFCP